MGIAEQFFLLLIFIFLSAFFSGVETAFISLSEIRVQHLADQQKNGILLVKRLRANNQRLIITFLIGNNLVNVAASSLATSLAIEIYESNAIGIAVGCMTLIILIFGEITPKTLAVAKNEWIAVHTAPAVRLFQHLFFPAIKMLEWMTMLLAKPFEQGHSEPIITEAEIKSVVMLGEQVGEVEEDERIMIHNIFRFSDTQANEIMMDRTQIFAVDAETKLEEAARQIVQKGFSRIPIYEDHIDKIIGILYAKDALQASLSQPPDMPVKNLIRPAMFIPETMLIDDLLREFQKEKVHIALVVDEHGGISGLVTIEDLLEEIVGDIYDETDKEKIMIRRIDDRRSVVKGETEIEEVNEVLGLGFSEQGDYETISGFILSELRRIPAAGEEIRIDGHTIRITKADPQRIIELQIEKAADDEEAPPPAAEPDPNPPR